MSQFRPRIPPRHRDAAASAAQHPTAQGLGMFWKHRSRRSILQRRMDEEAIGQQAAVTTVVC